MRTSSLSSWSTE